MPLFLAVIIILGGYFLLAQSDLSSFTVLDMATSGVLTGAAVGTDNSGAGIQSGIQSEIQSIGIQAEANASQCGYVNANLTMSMNLTNESTCFIINASHITLDCAGYAINYSTGGQTGYGINNTGGYDNLTVFNFGGINDFGSGIYTSGMNDSEIFNNSIFNANTTFTNQYGIFLMGSNGTRIWQNNIRTFGSGSGFGISFTLVFMSSKFSNGFSFLFSRISHICFFPIPGRSSS